MLHNSCGNDVTGNLAQGLCISINCTISFLNSSSIVSVWSRNGANKTKAFVKGHSWRQNEDYVGGATC